MTKRLCWMTFQADSDLEGKISEVRANLSAATPGVKISTSSTIRHLLLLGAKNSECGAPAAAPPA